MRNFFYPALLCALFSAPHGSAATGKKHARTPASASLKIMAPDGTRAVIDKAAGDEIIVSVGGARIDLTSPDRNHGRVFEKAQWSTDSRFFVFTTASSGGHSPWHHVMFVYNRATGNIANVDEATNRSCNAPDFSISTNNVLTYSVLRTSDGGSESVTQDLNQWGSL